MRLFIAADLSQEINQALSETSAHLREALKGRYTAPDTYHVTMAFMGEAPAASIPAITEALERSCESHRAFEASLGELGSFGRKNQATLWQGFLNPAPFTALAADIRHELSSIGIEFDAKPMRAHVTLMRKADLSSGPLPSPRFEKGLINSVTLYSSKLSSDGPTYTALHTAHLRD